MATKKGLRDYVSMECAECKNRNYRTSKQSKPRGGSNQPIAKLELKKFCKKCRVHTVHKERKK
jgi:large subunit ribosomal protein L33